MPEGKWRRRPRKIMCRRTVEKELKQMENTRAVKSSQRTSRCGRITRCSAYTPKAWVSEYVGPLYSYLTSTGRKKLTFKFWNELRLLLLSFLVWKGKNKLLKRIFNSKVLLNEFCLMSVTNNSFSLRYQNIWETPRCFFEWPWCGLIATTRREIS